MKTLKRSGGKWNYFKLTLLFAVPGILGAWLGWLCGGYHGMLTAFVLLGTLDVGCWGFSDRIVLAMHRAQPLAQDEAPEVFAIVRRLSSKAGIPSPRLFVLPSASANVFTVGRNSEHAAIAITHGLVGLLNEEELSGVLGHEVSHILHRDSLLASIVAVGAGVFSLLTSVFYSSFVWGGERDERDRENPLPFLLTAVIMPFAVALVQLTMARGREYAADRYGTFLCGEPLYLASALRKIDGALQRFPLRDATFATAHLFLLDPLSRKGWDPFFNTHPATEERIARLEGRGVVKDGKAGGIL